MALLVLPLYTSPWSLYWLVVLLPAAPVTLRSVGAVHGAVFHLSTRWVLLAAVAAWGDWVGARWYDAVAALLVLAQIGLAVALLHCVLRRVAVAETD